MSDAELVKALMRKIGQLERRLAALERKEPGIIRYAEANVTDAAPTNTQLDTAFGDAGTALFDGFVGIIWDTSGIGTVAHLAVVANGTWYVEPLALAA